VDNQINADIMERFKVRSKVEEMLGCKETWKSVEKECGLRGWRS
jgi:hypothetical protein